MSRRSIRCKRRWGQPVGVRVDGLRAMACRGVHDHDLLQDRLSAVRGGALDGDDADRNDEVKTPSREIHAISKDKGRRKERGEGYPPLSFIRVEDHSGGVSDFFLPLRMRLFTHRMNKGKIRKSAFEIAVQIFRTLTVYVCVLDSTA